MRHKSQPRRYPESALQTEIANFLANEWPDIKYTATLGGLHMPISQKMKLIRNGYIRGIPDMIIFARNETYCGVAIEVKSPTGRLTKEQKEWLAYLAAQGWCTYVAKDLTETRYFLGSYFGQCKPPVKEDPDLTQLSTMHELSSGKSDSSAMPVE